MIALHLVRTAGGELLAFGKNLEGQLGLGQSGHGRASVADPSAVRWVEEGRVEEHSDSRSDGRTDR